jgi:S1-C subfamily serine protease
VLAFVSMASACGADGTGSSEQDSMVSTSATGERSLAGSLSSAGSVPTIDRAEVRRQAQSRAMVVTGNGCGDAGGALGSGVSISPDRVLTAAHVIIGASEIVVSRRSDHAPKDQEANGAAVAAVESAENRSVPATVIALDPLRDLALLDVDLSALSAPSTLSTQVPDPNVGVLAEGRPGTIIGGLTSGDVDFVVADKTTIETDEVRGDRRSRRSGYRLEAETARGDSGAGLYDEEGRFVGLLFAVSTDDNSRSWATAGDEIESFLSDDDVAGSFLCNPERSRVERR